MLKERKTILIIEDDKDINRTLELRLEMEGFQVITAFDGYEGVYKAKNSHEDLVILDLMLPGLQGEEICKELRREKKYETVSIIMLTAKDSDADKVFGKVIGADCYMSKPFDMNDLLKNIHSLLKAKEMDRGEGCDM